MPVDLDGFVTHTHLRTGTGTSFGMLGAFPTDHTADYVSPKAQFAGYAEHAVHVWLASAAGPFGAERFIKCE